MTQNAHSDPCTWLAYWAILSTPVVMRQRLGNESERAEPVASTRIAAPQAAT